MITVNAKKDLVENHENSPTVAIATVAIARILCELFCFHTQKKVILNILIVKAISHKCWVATTNDRRERKKRKKKKQVLLHTITQYYRIFQEDISYLLDNRPRIDVFLFWPDIWSNFVET